MFYASVFNDKLHNTSGSQLLRADKETELVEGWELKTKSKEKKKFILIFPRFGWYEKSISHVRYVKKERKEKQISLNWNNIMHICDYSHDFM